MAIPGDHEIQFSLMALLLRQPQGSLRSSDVYTDLAKEFPLLSSDEKRFRYGNSVSHWANRVQFAVLHLRRGGWLLPPAQSGRGVWQLTDKGRAEWMSTFPDADDLLRELAQG